MVKPDILTEATSVLDLEDQGFPTVRSETSPREIVVELSLGKTSYPVIGLGNSAFSQAESQVVQQTKNLLAYSIPNEASRDYISRLIAQANGKNAFGNCLERFPAITVVTDLEREILLDLVTSKPYAHRIQELVVPLLFSSKGPDVERVMRSVFDSSLESDPVASALAGAWLLREAHNPTTHERVASRAISGVYEEVLYGTSRVHSLPTFVKGLLHSEDPLAVAIAGSSCEYRVGSFYRKNAEVEFSFKETLLKFVANKLGVVTTSSLENQAYATMRDLLKYPTHPIIGSAMIKLLAQSNKPENLEFLNSQLTANKGWLNTNDLVAGKRKFEIRKALGLVSPS